MRLLISYIKHIFFYCMPIIVLVILKILGGGTQARGGKSQCSPPSVCNPDNTSCLETVQVYTFPFQFIQSHLHSHTHLPIPPSHLPPPPLHDNHHCLGQPMPWHTWRSCIRIVHSWCWYPDYRVYPAQPVIR